jgi:hypothetical protein
LIVLETPAFIVWEGTKKILDQRLEILFHFQVIVQILFVCT